MMMLQISDVRDVVGITNNEVTIIGILLGLLLISGYVIIHLDKKRHEAAKNIQEVNEKRIQEALRS